MADTKTPSVSNQTLPASQAGLITIAKALITTVIGQRAGKVASSVFEVVGVICSVVEATAAQLQKSSPDGTTIHGSVKSELAFSIAQTVIDALYKSTTPLITKAVYDEATNIVGNASAFAPLVDAVIGVATDASTIQFVKQEAVQVGSCCKSFWTCGGKCC